MTTATIGQVIFFSFLGGIVSLVGGVLLLSRKNMANKLALYATPFAGGALLAAVFLDLLHEGVETSDAEMVLLATVIGIILFFLAEGFLHWFHHHHEDDKNRRDPKISLIIIGDTLHNALDGVAIAASFLISVPTGIVTTLAVAAHEIPQEIGDFGLLLSKGMKRSEVLLVNVMSAVATVLFAALTFALGSENALPLGFLFGLSAGFLLYIALSDVIPTIHNSRNENKRFSVQAILLVLGAVFVGLSIQVAHKYIDSDTAAADQPCVEIYQTDSDMASGKVFSRYCESEPAH